MNIEKSKTTIGGIETDVTRIYITDDFFKDDINRDFDIAVKDDATKISKINAQFFSIEEYEKNKIEILNKIYFLLSNKFIKNNKITANIVSIYQEWVDTSTSVGHAMFICYKEKSMDLIKQMEEKYPEMFGEFKKILDNEYETFAKKQRDYGPVNIMLGGNIDNDDDVNLSLKGITIRLNDKINRLITLLLKSPGKPENESIIDTFKDISVYGIIAQIVINRHWGR